MFTNACFIRKNTKELRDKLSKMGRRICISAEFEDSIWLAAYNHDNGEEVHGVGYVDHDISPFDNTDEVLNYFLEENKQTNVPFIDCEENDELFLSICALNNETDKNQWFFSTGWTNYKGNPIPDKWVFCDQDTLEHFAFVNNSPNSYSREMWKKATVQELINHFKLE
jgi:hypothetical protein